jgi:hypothetical protein
MRLHFLQGLSQVLGGEADSCDFDENGGEACLDHL